MRAFPGEERADDTHCKHYRILHTRLPTRSVLPPQ